MKSTGKKLSAAVVLAMVLLAIPLVGQIYRYYRPGTIWTVTTIRIHSGMDPAYLQYLDGAFKKDSDAAVKAKYMKSYKILRSIDDDQSSWNMLILREYDSLASLEANEEESGRPQPPGSGAGRYETDARLRESFKDARGVGN